MVFPEALKITILREGGDQDNFLMSVSRHREICHSFDNLRNEIVSRHPELLQLDEIKFFWIDDEKDEITILNHADYFDYMDAAGPTVQLAKRRIYVKGVRKPKTTSEDAPMEQETAATASQVQAEPIRVQLDGEDLPEHTNIVCDVCDETIRGHRYKCMQCFNYDLCMRCEAKFRHKDHMMVRIPKPDINRRAPFRLFEKLRSFAAEVGTHPPVPTEGREDEYENSKRSKRHHRRHSKDREESKERREEKERKERRHRRERSARSSDERRSAGHRRCGPNLGFGQHFNFSHLLNQVIDPANIHSAFVSADAAAAAAAAAAESAQEAALATLSNCPLFASTSTTTSTTATASASTTQNQAGPSTTAGQNTAQASASASSSSGEEPQAKKAAPTGASDSSAKTSPQQSVDVIDLSWLTPTPERIQKINETFSKILDPLGMNIEIRSNSASPPKPAQQTQTPTEEKQDKTTETANTPTTSTPSQTTPIVAGTSSKSTGMDPVVELEQKLQAALLADPLVKFDKNLEKKLQAALRGSDDEDDTSSVSSVSLLSDNGDTYVEASENSERRWTLVDIPNEDTDKQKTVSAVEIGKPAVEEPIASSSSVQAPATPDTPASVPEAASVSSAASQAAAQPIDYEQLGKALKQHLEAEKQASKDAAKAVVTPPAPKEVTPPAVTVPVIPTPAIPLPAAPVRVPPANFVFSTRPHVNHAVHTMMAMGFSNEGNWLTQLLDSVNGDIPRALDLLTPHKINP